MTLSTTSNIVRYTAADGQTIFPYPFRVDDPGHLEVYRNGTLLASGYAVSGIGDNSGGNVTLSDGAAAGDNLTLRRKVPLIQALDLPTQGALNTDALEADGLDRGVMIDQQQEEELGRTFKAPVESSVNDLTLTPSASQLIGWNAAGDALVNYALDGATSLPATAFARDLLDDTTAAEARTTLGVDVIHDGTNLLAPNDPTGGGHVGDRDYNDTRYLTRAGGAMSGELDMGGFDITNIRRIEDADSDTYLAVLSSGDLDDVQVGCEGNVVATFSADVPLTTTHANASDLIAHLKATHASYVGQGLKVQTTRAGHAGFNLAMFTSNNDADVEFRFTGDGNAQCDGSWTGGGAGYAEAFEWDDGNPTAEDRVGMTVVLVPDTDRIRPAVAGEDPDGVITARPTVAGRAAPMRWDGKYRRDGYGRPVLDENGERVRHPTFDETRAYTPRLKRKEWDLVSLLGLEPVRDGQPVSGRWTRAGKGAGVTRYVIR